MKTEAPSVAEVAPFPCDVCGAVLDADHLEPGVRGANCVFCGAEYGRPALSGAPTPPPSGSAPEERSTDLGETLRTAREDRGESLEQVTSATNIRETYLQALEDGGASFEPYPGRVYGRFFLREYAAYLGLQTGPLLRAFDREGEPVLSEPPAPIGRRPPRPRRWAIGAVVVLVVALVGTALLRRLDAPPTIVSPPTVPASASAPPPTSPSVEPARPIGVHAVATFTASCWVVAVVDGRTVVPGTTYQQGQTLHLHGTRTLVLTLGNAGGAELEVNGHAITTGGDGQVVHLSFAWQRGRLVRA